ncbi:unnamed protein product [Lactuca saligna]|uniref:Protein kinase domain-containing protein n=1 Tax=Lactuca saligna TaxID=75948 RepID=A0AA35Z6F7_LACSI|nr:unnamed protein product [Lactuca saligna]
MVSSRFPKGNRFDPIVSPEEIDLNPLEGRSGPIYVIESASYVFDPEILGFFEATSTQQLVSGEGIAGKALGTNHQSKDYLVRCTPLYCKNCSSFSFIHASDFDFDSSCILLCKTLTGKVISRFPILSRSYIPLALTDFSPFLETNVGHLNSNPLRIPALIHSQKSKNLVVYPTVYQFRILGDRILPHLWFVAYTTASPPCSTLICPSLSVLYHLLHMVMFMNVLFLFYLRVVSFGTVYKGYIDENVRVGLNSLPVAVKTEVNFLVQLRHPNLVKLIGYCCEDDHILLVYEFMFRGSLENHLFRRGRNTMHGHKSGTNILLDVLSSGSPPAPAPATQKSALDTLSSPIPTPGASPMMDLLDGFGPNPTPPPPPNTHTQFLQLHLEPASSNTLPGKASGSITQKLRVTKNQHGKITNTNFFQTTEDLEFNWVIEGDGCNLDSGTLSLPTLEFNWVIEGDFGS